MIDFLIWRDSEEVSKKNSYFWAMPEKFSKFSEQKKLNLSLPILLPKKLYL